MGLKNWAYNLFSIIHYIIDDDDYDDDDTIYLNCYSYIEYAIKF